MRSESVANSCVSGRCVASAQQATKMTKKFKEKTMLLMEEIYTELRKNDLVETAEQFSTDWCWRSRSWYAVQKNKGNDLSVATAITCLNNAKVKIALAHLKRRKLGSIVDDEIEALGFVKVRLETYLLDNHKIAAVAGNDGTCGKML